MVKTSNRKIAILIDADNMQSNLLPGILKATEKYGKPMIRRVYGDWSSDDLHGWIYSAKRSSFELKQVTTHSTNKNATDIGMVIDAMDILRQGTMDGFCIVSNDSDFTELCIRLRSAGLFIMGVGNTDASKALKNACEAFVALDTIKSTRYKRRRGFYSRKKHKGRSNPSSDAINQTDEPEATVDDTSHSYWSRFKSVFVSFNTANETDKAESISSSDNGSDWRSRIGHSATLPNGKSNATETRPSSSNGVTSSDWQRQLQQSSPLKQGKSGNSTPAQPDKNRPSNNAPKTMSNGNKTIATPATQTKESASSRTPQPPVQIEKKTTDSKLPKPVNTQPVKKPDNQARTKTVAKSPLNGKPNSQAEYWQPHIEELGKAYLNYLVLGLYHTVEKKGEWLPLDEINIYLKQLSPKFNYKFVGHKRLVGMLNEHPKFVRVKSEGKGKSKEYFVKFLLQQPTQE